MLKSFKGKIYITKTKKQLTTVMYMFETTILYTSNHIELAYFQTMC